MAPTNGKDNAASGFVTIAGFESGTTFVEAYGLLLASLVLARNGQPVAVVAVTAAHDGDGTTTTVLNLSMIMARAGRRVLAADVNLRSPQLHRAFEVDQSPGVADVISQVAPIGDAIRSTAVPNLDVLPAGTLTEPPPALLGVQRLGALVTALRSRYDFVVVDTPPVLQYPDALNIARTADGVILVVPAEQTSRQTQRETKRRLDRGGATILGAVLNRVSPRDVRAL